MIEAPYDSVCCTSKPWTSCDCVPHDARVGSCFRRPAGPGRREKQGTLSFHGLGSSALTREWMWMGVPTSSRTMKGTLSSMELLSYLQLACLIFRWVASEFTVSNPCEIDPPCSNLSVVRIQEEGGVRTPRAGRPVHPTQRQIEVPIGVWAG